MKFIVSAGGQGTKLWPYSTKDTPKQFQMILGQRSLYQHNIDILLEQYDAADIFISTKESYIKYVKEQSPMIPEENYLIEPDIRRDRGPGDGLAILRLSLKHPDEPFMVVQSDCIREPSDRYIAMIAEMERVAVETHKLVTGGIKTEKPIVGIDYLSLGAKIKSKSGLEIHEIEKFVERPQTMTEIEEIIRGATIITHSNQITWYPEEFLAAYKKYKPSWYKALMTIKEAIGTAKEREVVEKVYAGMDKAPTEVVTKKIMNQGGAVAVVLPYNWSDIGTWSSLHDYFSTNGQNYIDAETSLVLDSNGSIVKTQSKKLVAMLGVEDIVVVETDDALLVMNKRSSGDVGKVLDELKNRGLDKYL